MSGSARRLAEEMQEDGVELEERGAVRDLLLDELDYARRIPMFEGRRPMYGSFSMLPGTSITSADGIADLVPLDEHTRRAMAGANPLSLCVLKREEKKARRAVNRAVHVKTSTDEAGMEVDATFMA